MRVVSSPPVPTVPALLLAVAARFGYRVTARDPSGGELGVMTEGTADRHLVIASGGADGTWTVLDALAAGFGPVLISRATYAVLHGGALGTDGSVLYQGRAYRVR